MLPTSFDVEEESMSQDRGLGSGNVRDLAGQVVLVTGGGRGLGRAFAQALAEAGAVVAAVSRTSEELEETVRHIEAAGGQAAAFRADVTDWAMVQTLVEQVERRLGPIAVLVTAAGIYGTVGPLAEADPETWWRTMEANLRSKVLCARAVLPGMIARRRGRIINMGSSAGAGGGRNMSAYACSYAAVLRLTGALAAEGAEHGVSVFSISPGTVGTEAVTRVAEGEWGKWIPALHEALHAGRLNPPDRAAQLVVLLAAGKADALSGRHVGPRIIEELSRPERVEEIVAQDLYTLRLRT